VQQLQCLPAIACRLNLAVSRSHCWHGPAAPNTSCIWAYACVTAIGLALQDSVELLLVLAHKYEIKVPLQLCTQFLRSNFSTTKYASLPEEVLRRLPAWLSNARHLYLTKLHSSIMACLADNLSKLNIPGQATSASTYQTKVVCKACRSSGYRKYLDSHGYCGCCWQTHTDAVRPAVKVFQMIWGVKESPSSNAAVARVQVVSALQQGLEPAEAMRLLMVLVARDYTGKE
jgi:hypothetical protein